MCFLNILNVASKTREVFYYLDYETDSINTVSAKFRLFDDILNHENFFYKNQAVNEFCQAQKVYHTMTKFMRLKRAKNMNIEEDLSCTPLSEYNDKFKIDIIQNNNLFTFLLRDLHCIWLKSLTYSSNMMSEPQRPKNPYNNIVFTQTNLYNIYFALFFNGFRINKLIHSHVSENLSYQDFVYNNSSDLLEHSLMEYIQGLSDISCYNMIRDLKMLYPRHTQRIYYNDNFPANIKVVCVKKLRKAINYYILMCFADNFAVINLKEEYYRKNIIKELKKTQNFIFCRPYISIEYHDDKRKQSMGYYFEDECCVY